MPATPKRVANDVTAATFGCFHAPGTVSPTRHRESPPGTSSISPSGGSASSTGRSSSWSTTWAQPDRGRRTDGDARRHGSLSPALRTSTSAAGHRGRSAAGHNARHGMTHNDEFIGQLESYLDEYEGSTPLPEDVRDAIRAELPLTRQRPAWWPARRRPNMNNTAKLSLAAAAVVVAALLGFRFLVPGTGLGGPGPTRLPRPSRKLWSREQRVPASSPLSSLPRAPPPIRSSSHSRCLPTGGRRSHG